MEENNLEKIPLAEAIATIDIEQRNRNSKDFIFEFCLNNIKLSKNNIFRER